MSPKKIKAIKKHYKFTYEAFSKKMDVSMKTITNWCYGLYKPRKKYIPKLEKLYAKIK